MEVDLELGLTEATNLTVLDWSHVQELDYEQLPFKCRYFHDHGHFARYCKKKAEEEVEKNKDQLTQAHKYTPTRTNSRKKGKEMSGGSNVLEVRHEQEKGHKDQRLAKARNGGKPL